MKYLITGGCGFMGSNLAQKVLELNEKLLIFDNMSRKGASLNLEWLRQKGKFDFIKSDVRNKKNVEKAIKDFQPDIIFHLAGQVAMTTSLVEPYTDFEINTLGTLNVLEAIRNFSQYTVLIYSSTNKVYGDLDYIQYKETPTRYIAEEYPDGFNENCALKFSTPYGCSKGAADQYVLDYSKIYNIKTVVFRHSSAVGIRQFSTVDQGWVGWFVQHALKLRKGLNSTCTISGNGKQVRDILFSSDLVECYFSAIKHINDANGHALNIGGGEKNSLSLLELFLNLEEMLDIKINYEELPFRQSDQKIFIANIEKAKKILRWEPKTGVKSGLMELINWMR